jgi:hypothetical protein
MRPAYVVKVLNYQRQIRIVAAKGEKGAGGNGFNGIFGDGFLATARGIGMGRSLGKRVVHIDLRY